MLIWSGGSANLCRRNANSTSIYRLFTLSLRPNEAKSQKSCARPGIAPSQLIIHPPRLYVILLLIAANTLALHLRGSCSLTSMRLMVITFTVVFLVIVDQTQFHGYYGLQFARLVVSTLAQIGL